MDYQEIYKTESTNNPYPLKKNFRKKCDCGHPHCKEIIEDRAGFITAMDTYRKKNREIENKIKQMMFKELGISNHPARDIMWSKAWEDGHSYGFNEVFVHLDDIVRFVDDVINSIK